MLLAITAHVKPPLFERRPGEVKASSVHPSIIGINRREHDNTKLLLSLVHNTPPLPSITRYFSPLSIHLRISDIPLQSLLITTAISPFSSCIALSAYLLFGSRSSSIHGKCSAHSLQSALYLSCCQTHLYTNLLTQFIHPLNSHNPPHPVFLANLQPLLLLVCHCHCLQTV